MNISAPTPGQFMRFRPFDALIIAQPPGRIALVVFLLVFVVQVAICAFEGTLLPSPKVAKPLVTHLTLLIGGTLLIPGVFYALARFYRETSSAFARLASDGILSPDSLALCLPRASPRQARLFSAAILLATLLLTTFQFRGANANIDYIHMIGGRLTICGWYYTALFVPLAYVVLHGVIDLFIFSSSISRLCSMNCIKPKPFHCDGQYGLSSIIQLGQILTIIAGLLGFYFAVIFLNRGSYHTFQSLLINPEELLMMASIFVLTPLLLLRYYAPIKRLMKRHEEELLASVHHAYNANALDLTSPTLRDDIRTLHRDGFFQLRDLLRAQRSRLFEFKLIAQVYSILIIPLCYPIAIGIAVELAVKKVSP